MSVNVRLLLLVSLPRQLLGIGDYLRCHASRCPAKMAQELSWQPLNLCSLMQALMRVYGALMWSLGKVFSVLA